MKLVATLLVATVAAAILVALSISRFQSEPTHDRDVIAAHPDSAAQLDAATHAPPEISRAVPDARLAQSEGPRLSGPFPTPDERYRDPYLVHPEFAEYIQTFSDSDLKALADGGDAAALHFLAGRAIHRGETAAAIEMYFLAAELGSVVSLLRVGHELERLAASDLGAGADPYPRIREAMAAHIAGATFGYSDGVGSAADTVERNPGHAFADDVCERAWEVVDQIQERREARGMPRLSEVDRAVVRRGLQSYGICTA